MPKAPNLLDFSGVDSFDLTSIAQSMGRVQQNVVGLVDRDRRNPAPMQQTQEAQISHDIKERHIGTTDSDSPPFPAPVVRDSPPIKQGNGALYINRPDPAPAPSPSPPRLLLRKVFGNPPARTAAEWDKLARKARKLWQQKSGVESAVACVELCYFSTAARWVTTRGKPDAVMYHHPLKEMAYPDKYKDFLEQGGGMGRYQ